MFKLSYIGGYIWAAFAGKGTCSILILEKISESVLVQL